MYGDRQQQGGGVSSPVAWVAAGSVALVVLGLLGGDTTASAATIGFDVNSVEAIPLFLYDNQDPNDPNDNVLTAGPTQVDLSLELDGPELMFSKASFEFQATLAEVVTLSFPGPDPNIPGLTAYLLVFDGSFSFTEIDLVDPNNSMLIMDATFTDARMLLIDFGETGSVNNWTGLSGNDNANNVDFQFGPAVPGYSVTGGEQFQFTVNRLQDESGGSVGIDDSGSPPRFENFTFNSSFSGSMTVEIPEPATVGLAALGLVWFACRRRPRLARA